MSADVPPACPRCKGSNVDLTRQELCYRRIAKGGMFKGMPKLESTTTTYHCHDCNRDFAIRVEGD